MRKVFKRIFRWLPSSVRQQIVRDHVRLPMALPSGLRFKIAETTDELEASFSLVYDAYLKLGYCEPNESRMRATVYHALPSTTTIIALDQDRVVGTLTIVRDNRLKLPLEKIFDVNSLRNNACRLAEITSLVIHKDYRREKGGMVLFPLLKLMYEYSVEYFGVDHLVVTVPPDAADFYKGLLLFDQIPQTQIEDYLGAPAVALHLDLKKALYDYERQFANTPDHRNIFQFFVKLKLDNILLPDREFKKINDPIVTTEYFHNVFVNKLKISASSIPGERRQVESYLRHSVHRRQQPRHDVEAPARISFQGGIITENAKIKDVSRFGLRAYFKEHLVLQPEYFIVVQVANEKYAHLKVKAVWMSPSQGVGFEIIDSDDVWREFLFFLHQDDLGKTG